MKLLKSHDESAVKEACRVLSAGGIILYPTDTVYGLGVDATNADSIRRLFALKNRSDEKAILIMVSGMEMARNYVEVGEVAEALMKRYWPGQLSIVLPARRHLPDILEAGSKSIGVRMPDHPFCLELVKRFGKPVTTTSANVSGREVSQEPKAIWESFGESADLIDLVIDEGKLPKSAPSTVVGIEDAKVHMYREGAIPRSAIEDYLASIDR